MIDVEGLQLLIDERERRLADLQKRKAKIDAETLLVSRELDAVKITRDLLVGPTNGGITATPSQDVVDEASGPGLKASVELAIGHMEGSFTHGDLIEQMKLLGLAPADGGDPHFRNTVSKALFRLSEGRAGVMRIATGAGNKPSVYRRRTST